MNQSLKILLASLLSCLITRLAYSAQVEWDKAFVMYEGLDYSGVYERYTMGSPFLNILARREGSALELWAQPEVNLVAANTFVLLSNVLMESVISSEMIYGSSDYFAYAVYTDSVGGYEEKADYSVVISQGESVYLGFASQPATLTDPVTCGWIELGLDGEGSLTVIRSAWDRDGDPITVGATPEPSGALLLLVGGALLALRRRDAAVAGRTPYQRD